MPKYECPHCGGWYAHSQLYKCITCLTCCPDEECDENCSQFVLNPEWKKPDENPRASSSET